MAKRIGIVRGVTPVRWVLRGPRRWDFHIWLPGMRKLYIFGGGPLLKRWRVS